MKFIYVIIEDSTGKKTTIIETQRQKAIEKYLESTGMPEDFFKQHCKIENIGRIK